VYLEKTTSLPQVTDKHYHIAMSGIQTNNFSAFGSWIQSNITTHLMYNNNYKLLTLTVITNAWVYIWVYLETLTLEVGIRTMSMVLDLFSVEVHTFNHSVTHVHILKNRTAITFTCIPNMHSVTLD